MHLLTSLSRQRSHPQHSTESYSLHGHSSQAQPPVSREAWLQHTLATGNTQAWLRHQLIAQQQRQGAGVFVNTLATRSSKDVLPPLPDTLVQLDLDSPATGPYAINLLADLSPDAVATTLLAALPDYAPDLAPLATFQRNQLFQCLTTLADTLLQLGDTLTLPALLAPLQTSDGSALHTLLSRCPEGSRLQAQMQKLLRVLTNREGHLDVGLTHQNLVADLSDLLATPGGTLLFSANPSAPSIGALLNQGNCLALEKVTPALVRLLLPVLTATIARRAPDRHTRFAPPWVLGLGDIGQYPRHQLLPLLHQGRSTQVAVLFTTRETARPQWEGLIKNRVSL